MLYWYKALKGEKVITGKLEANVQNDVIAFLKNNNYFPIEVKKIDSGSSLFGGILNRTSFTDIVDLTRQLAIMLNAGLTLLDCFEILKKQNNFNELKNFLHKANDIFGERKEIVEELNKF